MRVLLAIDGSASADAARQLVASLRWPEGSCIRVLAVVEPVALGFAGLSPYPVRDIDESEISTSLGATLADAAKSLETPGRGVEGRLVRGRAASAIVDEAREFRAELVVVGSRGLGRLSAMVLGSVSAEVVDHAPCPVLVARSASVGRVLVAVDGSASAHLAVDHVGGTGYLAGHPMEVLAVGPQIGEVASMVPAAAMTDALFRSRDGAVTEARQRTETIAAAAAEQLLRDGLVTRWSISAGDPAHEILEAAGSLGCDLIAMGSRGLTGLQRVLLGSVARNVLLHTTASVLIVREPVRERLPERRTRDVARSAVTAAG